MDLQSHITYVTLFPDRARLTRQARVTLEAGRQRVSFKDLPLSLAPDSLRAAARGFQAGSAQAASAAQGSGSVASAMLLGLDLRREHYTETPAEIVRELETQIATVEDQDQIHTAEIAAHEAEAAQLTALGAQAEMYARGVALRGRPMDEVGALYAYIRERTVDIQKALVTIKRRRTELKKELDRLKRELNEQYSARPRVRLTADVELSVEQGGEFEIDLASVIANAHWDPLYDLRLGPDGSALEVGYLANLSQNTGEDWIGVEITLSTSSPTLALIAPDLDPWYIGPRPAPVPLARGVLAKSAAPQAVTAAPTAAMAASQPEMLAVEEARFAEARVGASGAAVTYRLADRADVPGNGEPRKVAIATFPLKPELDYITAPKLANAAYRRAKVKNDSPYSLLPGRAQLFEGDEYLGATDLEFVAPGQEFELTLGTDDRVRVERELKLREVDKKLIADRRRIRYAYEIKVTNLRPSPQTITVCDQIPVSRHESIKVKLDAAVPALTKQSELNLLEWKLSLGPGETQTVRCDFTVEHPREMEVVGLE